MSDTEIHPEEQGSSAPRRAAGRPPRSRASRRKGVWIVLGALALIIAVLAGIGAVYYGNLKHSFESKSHRLEDVFPDESSRPSKDGKSMNILLLGSDKRPQPVAKKDAVPGGGADERSDSIMLVNISGDRKHVTVMSIMRDLWVDVPGHGKSKVNSGYAYGGRKLEVQTIENLLKTRIDHVAVVDMGSFKAFGDSLGGLDVNVEKRTPMTRSDGSQFVLEPGKHHMDGGLALAFSRERKVYANGDYQRVRNQQAVMRAIMSKLITKDTMTDPRKIQSVVDETSPYISIDKQFAFDDMTKLAFSLRGLKTSDIEFATMPTAGIGWSDDGQSIVQVDEKGLASVQKALKEDKMHDWLSSPENHEKGK